MADVNNKISLIILFLLFLFEIVIINGNDAARAITIEKRSRSAALKQYRLYQRQQAALKNTRTPVSHNQPSTPVAKKNSYNGNRAATNVISTRQQGRSNHNLTPTDRSGKSQQPARTNTNSSNRKPHNNRIQDSRSQNNGNTGVGVVKTTKQQVGSNRNKDMHRCELCWSHMVVKCVESPDKTSVCDCLLMKNTRLYGSRQQKCYKERAMPRNTGVADVKTTKQQDGSNRKEGNTGVGVVKTTKQQVGSNRNKDKHRCELCWSHMVVKCVESPDKTSVCDCLLMKNTRLYGSRQQKCYKERAMPKNTGVGVVKTTEQPVESNRNRNLTPKESQRKQQQSTQSNSNNANVAGSASVDKNNNQVNVAGSASVGSNKNEVNLGSSKPQDNGQKSVDEVQMNDGLSNLTPLQGFKKIGEPKIPGIAKNEDTGNNKIQDNLPQDERISKPFETQPAVTISQPTDSVGELNNNNGLNTKVQQIQQRYKELLSSMNSGTWTPWQRYNDNSFLVVVIMLFSLHVMFKVCS